MGDVSVGVFALVLCSSVFHATWNFLARKVKGNMGVIYLAQLAAVFFLLPAVITVQIIKPAFLNVGWHVDAVLFVFLTGTAHSLYFLFLGASYKYGEISVVYPIARGTGIAGTTLIAYFALGEDISFPMGWLGILLILSGVVSIGLGKYFKGFKTCIKKNKVYIQLRGLKERPETEKEDFTPQTLLEEEKPNQESEEADQHSKKSFLARLKQNQSAFSIVLALGVGLTISGYSISDKLGVFSMDPISYIWFSNLTSWTLTTPLIYWRYRDECILSIKQFKRYIVVVGFMTPATYLAILFAFQLANVSYIVAIREMSVIIGSILGVVILKEEMNIVKGVGIVAIVMGLVLLKLA